MIRGHLSLRSTGTWSREETESISSLLLNETVGDEGAACELAPGRSPLMLPEQQGLELAQASPSGKRNASVLRGLQ